jgi:S-adenosyl-L-methionine hydrolase (adenosine-forming)
VPLVTFLSDFGLDDELVGVCKGVIAGIAPSAAVVDLSHGIQPQDVRAGAAALAAAVGYFPQAIHLAVVDPGVGGSRAPIILSSADGSLLVGPDNGLLQPAAALLGGATTCRRISNPALMLQSLSATFHGRDIFSPAVGHLANGVPMEQFGPPLPLDGLVELFLALAERHGDHLHAEVRRVDGFGNLQLNVAGRQLRELGLRPGSSVGLCLARRGVVARWAETYSEVAVGEPVLAQDSQGLVAASLRNGSAATAFGAGRRSGCRVVVGAAGCAAQGCDAWAAPDTWVW